MNTIKINKKNVKIVAHRGLSGIEVENTNAAFVAAGNRSYYGIETDIYMSQEYAGGMMSTALLLAERSNSCLIAIPRAFIFACLEA